MTAASMRAWLAAATTALFVVATGVRRRPTSPDSRWGTASEARRHARLAAGATKAECGAPTSTKVVAVVQDHAEHLRTSAPPIRCAMRSTAQPTPFAWTSDWVIGGCMSVDPQHRPVQVDCGDSVPHRRRESERPRLSVSVATSAPAAWATSTLQRRFAVCVEDVTGGPRSARRKVARQAKFYAKMLPVARVE